MKLNRVTGVNINANDDIQVQEDFFNYVKMADAERQAFNEQMKAMERALKARHTLYPTGHSNEEEKVYGLPDEEDKFDDLPDEVLLEATQMNNKFMLHEFKGVKQISN